LRCEVDTSSGRYYVFEISLVQAAV
jgi:hypothetical protein